MDLPTTMGGGGMLPPGGTPIITTIANIGIAVAVGDGDTAPRGITAASDIMAATDG